MSRTGKIKKRDIIVLSAVTIIILAAVIIPCAMLCPRSLSTIIDVNGIESIEVMEYGETVRTLTAEGIGEFSDIVKSSKYKRVYAAIKATSVTTFKINYRDKHIVLSEFRIAITDGEGNTAVKEISLDMSEFYKL